MDQKLANTAITRLGAYCRTSAELFSLRVVHSEENSWGLWGQLHSHPYVVRRQVHSSWMTTPQHMGSIEISVLFHFPWNFLVTCLVGRRGGGVLPLDKPLFEWVSLIRMQLEINHVCLSTWTGVKDLEDQSHPLSKQNMAARCPTHLSTQCWTMHTGAPPLLPWLTEAARPPPFHDTIGR